MLSQKMQDALNEQIRYELGSAYLYLAMAAYCDSENLPGFAHWMRLQAKEELDHAMRFYKYVNERGGRVVLQALEGPPVEFESPQDVFAQTLAHEQFITGRINELYTLALAEKDYATQSFLTWFIDEQVEEEAHATGVLETLKMIGEKGQALIMLDRQLARRGAE
mgnify:CR=1 FL=1